MPRQAKNKIAKTKNQGFPRFQTGTVWTDLQTGIEENAATKEIRTAITSVKE